jgi:hypothetical protein
MYWTFAAFIDANFFSGVYCTLAVMPQMLEARPRQNLRSQFCSEKELPLPRSENSGARTRCSNL